MNYYERMCEFLIYFIVYYLVNHLFAHSVAGGGVPPQKERMSDYDPSFLYKNYSLSYAIQHLNLCINIIQQHSIYFLILLTAFCCCCCGRSLWRGVPSVHTTPPLPPSVCSWRTWTWCNASSWEPPSTPTRSHLTMTRNRRTTSSRSSRGSSGGGIGGAGQFPYPLSFMNHTFQIH